MSRCVARSSMPATWRHRSRPRTPARSMWRRAHGLSPSTISRRPPVRPTILPFLGRARRRSTPTWRWDNDVEPDRIRWIRPREAWFYDRRYFQPLEQVGAIMEGLALDAEAGADAVDVEDLFARLEASGRVVRIDQSGRRGCTAARCSAPPSSAQCGRSRMSSGSAACGGSRPTGSCSSAGRPRPAPMSCTWTAPPRPERCPRHADLSAWPDRAAAGPVPLTVLQRRPNRLRRGPSHDDADKNRLRPPHAYPSRIEDWPRMMRSAWTAESRWLREPVSQHGSPTAGSTCSVRSPTTPPNHPCRQLSTATSHTSGRRATD